MIREELALVKQNGAWKPRRKKGWSGLFYPPNGLNFQFCWFNLIFLIAPSWSESNFILFLFFHSIRVGPSRSELIRPGLAIRVDPVRLLYLPLENAAEFPIFCHTLSEALLLSSEQHFAGIFASEPMTLPEIDHVSFLVEHAQTFFAGEGILVQAKGEHMWKLPHVRKARRDGERKMRDYRQSPSIWPYVLLSPRKTLIGSSMEISQHLLKTC